MLMTITSKRQVTFPVHVLAALGAKPGDQLELKSAPNGFVLSARRIDTSRLAPLRGKLCGKFGSASPAFDIERFRAEAHDPALRD
jgi:bifunctional DNA-binding transcriptional regulator/antitoxin component of YhaV-PrlF toxin-antitoxin module